MEFQTLMAHAPEMNPQFFNRYTLYVKYNLIIEVTVNLDESFNLIRTCVLKEISLVYFSPLKLMKIPEFTRNLIVTLERKNLATDFRKKVIPAGKTRRGATGKKKNPAISAKAQFCGNTMREFDKEYTSRCHTSVMEDERRKSEILSSARTRINTANIDIKDNAVVDDPVVKKAIGIQPICGTCLSRNCQLRQTISKELGMAKLQTNVDCKGGRKLKFSDIYREEENGPTPEEPTAAAREVLEFLNDLDNGEDGLVDAAVNLRVNMVTIEALDTEEDDEQKLEASEASPIRENNIENHTGVSRGGETEYSATGEDENASSAQTIAALFEEIEAERSNGIDSSSAATFSVTCTYKRPVITENNIPTKANVKKAAFTPASFVANQISPWMH